MVNGPIIIITRPIRVLCSCLLYLYTMETNIPVLVPTPQVSIDIFQFDKFQANRVCECAFKHRDYMFLCLKRLHIVLTYILYNSCIL